MYKYGCIYQLDQCGFVGNADQNNTNEMDAHPITLIFAIITWIIKKTIMIMKWWWRRGAAIKKNPNN